MVLHHIKRLLHSKRNYQQNKRPLSKWEKIFADDTLEKGLIPKIYKEFIQFYIRKTQTRWLKTWDNQNRYFSTEDTQMASRCMKSCSVSLVISSVQFSSVAQSCPTLCKPVNHSMPGFPVYHQLPEFTQTHVHWIGDAIQPSHPLLSPSPPALNLSQNQGIFQWVSSSHQVAKVLEFQL